MSANPSEILVNHPDRCGEAPIWDPRAQRLLWADIPADVVYTVDPQSGLTEVLSRGLNVSGIALDRSGQVLAGAGGLYLRSQDGGVRTLLTEHEGITLVFNDFLAAPGGRLYAGTIYWGAEMERTGCLYLVHPGGGIETVDDGIELANGLALSPDDRTLYFADSAARRIFAYDIHPNSGRLSGRRILVEIPTDDGIPDGLTTDSEGFLWVACWYGGKVLRCDPEGKIERRVPLPALQVSSVAFGGPECTELYVTSAAEPWPSHLAPPGYDASAPNQGGALYRLRPGVAGRAGHVASLGEWGTGL